MLQDYVVDKDCKGVSKYRFSLVGDILSDSTDTLNWSPREKPQPIKISSNGTLYTDYKFREDDHGLLTVNIAVNDSSGGDTTKLKVTF